MIILVISSIILIMGLVTYNYYFKQNNPIFESLTNEPVVEEQPFIPEEIKPKSKPRKRSNKKTAGRKPAAKTKK